ncbi:MAG TPA: DUF2637 domain-containing protein [Kribbella sp.]
MTQTAELDLSTADRSAALAYYAAELDRGNDPSAKELAELFHRTDRWARNIRSEVDAERRAAAERGAAEAERTAVPLTDLGPATETINLPADSEPVPADRTDDLPAVVDVHPEIPVESGPVQAPTTPPAAETATWTEAMPENLPPFALNSAQDTTTADLPTTGQPPDPTAIEPHTTAPSWTVHDPAADLTPETPAVETGTLTVPQSDPAAGPVVPAERDAEPVIPAGTVTPSADTDPEATPETPEHEPEHRKVPGRFVAWLAFVTGIGASVAANMLHAAEGGAHAAELIGAAFWPLALLLSIELLTRVTWPKGWLWGTGRFVGVGLVAVVAFVLSYRHMAGLLTSWGEDAVNAYLGPLAVDGLMLVAATALLAITRTRKNHP